MNQMLIPQNGWYPGGLDQIAEMIHSDELVIAINLLHGFTKVLANPTALIMAAALLTVSWYSYVG